MSRRARFSFVVIRVLASFAFYVATEHAALAAQFDCSQPVTNGPKPTATDCLFILKVAVGAEVCSPACICAPKGTLPTTAVDALVCLKYAVGQPVELNCPCTGTSTTLTLPPTSTTSTSSTTLPGGGGTTTTLPTVPDYGCTLDAATCTESACTCSDLGGLDYHLGGNGTMHGPVGTQLRVNTQLQQGGVIDCGAWTKIGANVNPSCDTIGCCERQGGDPESAQWNVFEVFNFQCFCPNFPGATANILVQCQLNPYPVKEHESATAPCP